MTGPRRQRRGRFVAPTGTPKAVIDKIYQDTVKVLQSPDIRTRFEQLGMMRQIDRCVFDLVAEELE